MDDGTHKPRNPHSAQSSFFRELSSQFGRTHMVLLALLLASIAALVFLLSRPVERPPTAEEIEAIVARSMASATPRPSFSSQVHQRILPSLVLVKTQVAGLDPEEGEGIGSGVVVNAEGDILTALHVVSGAESINVTFADGTESPAELLSAQPENDIAVLHPTEPPDVIVPAVLGSASSVKVGDEAYAVGNPFGLPQSMSAGVISGFNRTFRLEQGAEPIRGLIQFDAAVNPGNSGGPLLNREGRVIGIVTGLANPSDQRFFIGIGLAVPISVAAAAAGAPPY